LQATVKKLYTSPGALEYLWPVDKKVYEDAQMLKQDACKWAMWCDNPQVTLSAVKTLWAYIVIAFHAWVFDALDFQDTKQAKMMFKETWPTIELGEAIKQLDESPEASSQVLDEVFKGDEQTAAQVESCWATYYWAM